jgi:carboxylate-amine ligase
MFRPSASCGVPQCFENWSEFCNYCHAMSTAGALESIKDLYWDIRPQPDLGTVEFRIFDVPTSISAVLGLTALTRSLVVAALQSRRDSPKASAGHKEVFWLANENRWLATRYGLMAECMRRPGEERRTLRDESSKLIDQLEPVSRFLGDDYFLKELRTPGAFKCGADQQRQLYREHGRWQAIIDYLKNAWMSELPDTPDSSRADSRTGATNPAIGWPTVQSDPLVA